MDDMQKIKLGDTVENWSIKSNSNFSAIKEAVDEAEEDILSLEESKVDKTTTIAGVDLQDNITKSELQTALNVADGSQVNVIEKIQKNGTDLEITNKTVNIAVPTTAGDVNALPSSTKYGASLSVSGTSVQLKDQDGNNLGSAITTQDTDTGATSVDETGNGNAYTGSSYDETTRKITFTKGSTFLTQHQDISGKLDKKPDGANDLIVNNKLSTTYMPDYILGQVLYGGNVTTGAVASLSPNAKAKLGTTDNSITLTNDTTAITGYEANEGIYYIATADFTFASLSILTGDWLISRGTAWDKIDNTDAITGVKGNAEVPYRIGNVNLTPDDFDDTDTTNKFVSASDKSSWNEAVSTIGDYGDIVTHDVDEFATSAQGGKADTAVQPEDLSAVATSGNYNDLDNLPTIPTVNDATLTIQKEGTTVGTFSANASSNEIVNIEETDPVFSASVAAGITSSDIDNWDSKSDFSGDYNDLSNKPDIPKVYNSISNISDVLTTSSTMLQVMLAMANNSKLIADVSTYTNLYPDSNYTAGLLEIEKVNVNRATARYTAKANASSTDCLMWYGEFQNAQSGYEWSGWHQVLNASLDQTVGGVKTFSSAPTLNNNIFLKGKFTGGTAYDLIGINSGNGVAVGNTSTGLILNTSSNVIPSASNTKNMGSPTAMWNTLYATNINDGTNSVTVENIVNANQTIVLGEND